MSAADKVKLDSISAGANKYEHPTGDGNLHVSVDGNIVSLRAEVRQLDQKTEGEKVLRSERYYGAVARSFQLPAEIDAAQAKAKYDHGVLTLTLPKKVHNASQRLSIE